MKYLFFIGLGVVLSFAEMHAQRMQLYNGFVAGRPIQLVMHQNAAGRLEGYCLDVNKKERYKIEGYYQVLGQYYRIECMDPAANFRFLSMRPSPTQAEKLEGIYYGDQIRGFFDLKLQKQGSFNSNRTVELVNQLYPKLFKDAEQPQVRPNRPFEQDVNSGLFFIDKDEARYLNSGLLLENRKIQEFQNVRVRFQDWALITDDYQQEVNLQFQIITYFPQLVVLAVIHEKKELYEQEDSLIQESFTFMLYEQDANQNWKNVTAEKTLGDDFLSRMQSSTQAAKFRKTSTYFVVETTGKNVHLNLNTPRTTLSIPDENAAAEVKVLQWHWQDKGLIFQ